MTPRDLIRSDLAAVPPLALFEWVLAGHGRRVTPRIRRAVSRLLGEPCQAAPCIGCDPSAVADAHAPGGRRIPVTADPRSMAEFVMFGRGPDLHPDPADVSARRRPALGIWAENDWLTVQRSFRRAGLRIRNPNTFDEVRECVGEWLAHRAGRGAVPSGFEALADFWLGIGPGGAELMAAASKRQSLALAVRGRGPGRPFAVTAPGRELAERLCASGCSLGTVAAALGIDATTLRGCAERDDQLRAAIDKGHAALETELVGLLLSLAREGDKVAAIFLLKGKCGWRDVGEDPRKPVERPNITINLPGSASPEDYRRMIDVTPAAKKENKQ